MAGYRLSEISRIVGGEMMGPDNPVVTALVYDSRRVPQPAGSLFFALHTAHADGHRYAADAYRQGVRAFVISQPLELEGVTTVLVPDTLAALQTLATHHRQQFSIPVIGITGSNGKRS